jgi:hypothetical protein
VSHKCPRNGCTRAVEPGKLMCRDDWALVPEPLQKAVYRAWGHGKGRGSAAHRAAILAAIRAVNREPEPEPERTADGG